MNLGLLAPVDRSASWPSEVTANDIAWLDAQWVLAGGRPAPPPLTDEERLALAGYFTWVTTEAVR